MDNNMCKIRRRLLIFFICQVMMLAGCRNDSQEKYPKKDNIEIEDVEVQDDVDAEVVEEESVNEEKKTDIHKKYTMLLIDDKDKHNETVVSEEKDKPAKTENFISDISECELVDEDFNVEYKGYIINAQTTDEDIINTIGEPDAFEDNNNGYIATVQQEFRWQLIYPGFSEQSEIRIIFYTDLDTCETIIKTVDLENLQTHRGVSVGDNINNIYASYGLPTEEKEYSANEEYIEMNYERGNQRISFVVDSESELIDCIYIDYNL